MMANLPTMSNEFIAYSAGAAMFILTVWALVKGLQRTPPIEAAFVSKEEFKEFKEEVKSDFTELQANFNADVRRLHERIEESTHELQTSGHRRGEEIRKEISELSKICGVLEERTRKL
ncbi:MAG: hypothetical protein SFY81_04885 [Verrucomicrobiota bacterium]|nr:hypothetical protein [Verrucomicrobiota bacterium]